MIKMKIIFFEQKNELTCKKFDYKIVTYFWSPEI